MRELDFKEYLESKGYYFSKELLENYLLSLKVKPFTILTGTPGVGKTKLAQLLSRYLVNENSEYYMIKVSTLKRSHSPGSKDKQVGWGIYKEYIDRILPVDKINGSYEVEIGGFTTHADISLGIQLYYDHNSCEIRKYFKKLHDKESLIKKEDKKANRKHTKQMVYLGVLRDSLNNLISENYMKNDEIILYPTLTKSVTSGDEKLVPFDIFDYMPFNKRSSSTVMSIGLFANAHFDVKLRMRNYATDEINDYLSKLYENHEEYFELKIKGFAHDFNEFAAYNTNSINSENYTILPVGADWNDGSHILGYYNVIKNQYQYTPANEIIKQAQIDPNNPYFLILDEMNRAYVERYFSDFLSSMESGEDIPLYGNDDTINLPKNLFFIGTVNADKNNKRFLSYVLDRTNVIELDNVYASEYMSNSDVNAFEGNKLYLQNPLMDCDISLFNLHDLKEVLGNINYKKDNLWELLSFELTELQKILKGSNFEFGFRVVTEILRFMVVAWRYENSPKNWTNWQRYFDAQIKQRILPKLEGSEKDISILLNNLFNSCLEERNNNENPLTFIINENNVRYYTSALKLQNMVKLLYEQNYVSFI